MTAAGSASNPESVIQLRDVRFRFAAGGPEVLRGLSAALIRGRLTVLLGPNAAGKSTLLRLMLGQLAATGGRIALDGRCVHGLEARRRATLLSYVPQRPAQRLAFTVRQIVAMGRHALPRDDAAIESALQRCALTPLGGRVYDELSVGQQQRVALARALAQSGGQGRAMLLDEPVSAMDLKHAHHSMQVIRSQARAGLAAMVVLHDLNLAAAYADDVWLLHDGRLIASGPWRTVLTPQSLQAAYGVELARLADGPEGRPVFHASLSPTMTV